MKKRTITLEDGKVVDSGVGIKMLVLRCQYGHLQIQRNFLVRYDDASFKIQFADNAAVVGENLRNDIRAVVFQTPHIRQVVFVPVAYS